MVVVMVNQGVRMVMAMHHDRGMMMLVMMLLGVRGGHAQQGECRREQQYLSNFHDFPPVPKRQMKRGEMAVAARQRPRRKNVAVCRQALLRLRSGMNFRSLTRPLRFRSPLFG